MRIKQLTTILAIGAATAVATVPVADARQGADDPVGHVRHSGADDGVTHTSNGTRTRTRTRGRHHVRHHGAGEVRHGADDGPNHT